MGETANWPDGESGGVNLSVEKSWFGDRENGGCFQEKWRNLSGDDWLFGSWTGDCPPIQVPVCWTLASRLLGDETQQVVATTPCREVMVREWGFGRKSLA